MKQTLLLILIFIIGVESNAQRNQLRDAKSEKHRFYTILYFSAGTVYGTSAYNFFQEYKGYFGGRETVFSNSPFLGGGTKIEVNEHFRLGAAGGYFNSEITEAIQEVDTLGNSIFFSNHELKIKSIPIMATFDYLPFNMNQFRTYVGFGAGITLSEIRWEENVSVNEQRENEYGGVYYDEQAVVPTFRIYTGVELGFDKRKYDMFLGSLILEVNFTYAHRKVEIFKSLINKFEDTPESWNDSFLMAPGYLNLNLGISFNISGS